MDSALIGCVADVWRRWADSPSVVGRYAFAPPMPSSYSERDLALHYAPRPDGQPPVPLLHLHPAHDGDLAVFADSPVVLMSHGNACDIGQMRKSMQMLADRHRVHVVLYEYDGYGVSGRLGVCSEQRCYSAIQAVYDWLVDNQSCAPEKILLYGQSLGTGPTVELAMRLSRRMRADAALRRLYGGVLLQSPFLSCMRVSLPYSFRWMDMFCNQDKARELIGPVVLVHGDQDQVVPHTHTHELAALIAEAEREFYIVEGAGHSNIFLHASPHSDAFDALLRRMQQREINCAAAAAAGE